LVQKFAEETSRNRSRLAGSRSYAAYCLLTYRLLITSGPLRGLTRKKRSVVREPRLTDYGSGTILRAKRDDW